MQNLELFLEKFNKILWGNWLVFVLLGLGILYSIATGFVQVRHFKFIIHNTLVKSFKERNIEIYEKYIKGLSISELSKEYFLSEKSIRRIIFNQKQICS